MTQLEMTDIPAPPRPTANDEMRRQAAEVVAKQLIADGEFEEDEFDEIADDIAQAGASGRDGYEIGKRLDDRHGWNCMSAGIVDTLDGFDYRLSEALRAAEKVWAEKFDIKPPLEVGTRVTVPFGDKGVITGVHEHSAAKYLVKIDGDPQADGPSEKRRIVNFEDCQVDSVDLVV